MSNSHVETIVLKSDDRTNVVKHTKLKDIGAHSHFSPLNGPGDILCYDIR